MRGEVEDEGITVEREGGERVGGNDRSRKQTLDRGGRVEGMRLESGIDPRRRMGVNDCGKKKEK